VRSRLLVSERRTCAVVGQPRETQRRRLRVRNDEAALTAAIERLATQCGRYGYRRIRRLLVDEGWQVLAGKRQAHLADLAAGGAESTEQATHTVARRLRWRDDCGETMCCSA
jgi:hypothetical protein